MHALSAFHIMPRFSLLSVRRCIRRRLQCLTIGCMLVFSILGCEGQERFLNYDSPFRHSIPHRIVLRMFIVCVGSNYGCPSMHGLLITEAFNTQENSGVLIHERWLWTQRVEPIL